MAEFFVKKSFWGNSLKPVDDDGAAVIKKLSRHEVYNARIWKPRCIKFLRKYFALINLIWEIQNHFENKTALRYWLQMKAGFYTMQIAPNGEPMYFPDSISFQNMDDIQFDEVYNKVINVAIAAENICGGITIDEIRDKVDKILAFT